MREIDAKYQEILKELDDYYEKFKREKDGTQKRRVLHCIQRALIRSQELGDEKIQIVSQMVELVENRTRQLDSHVELFEAHQDISDSTGSSGKAGQDKSKSETIAQAEKPNGPGGSETTRMERMHLIITTMMTSPQERPRRRKQKPQRRRNAPGPKQRGKPLPQTSPSTPTSPRTVCAIRSPMER